MLFAITTIVLCLATVHSPREWIEFDVRMPDGSAAVAARIAHEDPHIKRLEVLSIWLTTPDKEWSTDRPGIQLPDRAMRVWAVAGKEEGLDREYRSEVIEIDATSQNDDAYTLTLQPRVGLALSLSIDEVSIPGEVWILPLEPDEPVDLASLKRDGIVFDVRTPRLVLEAGPGRYLVGTTFGRGHPISAHTVVQVSDEIAEVALPQLSRQAPVAFEVELRTGGERYPGLIGFTVQARRGNEVRLVDWLDYNKPDGTSVLIPDAAGHRLLEAAAANEAGTAATLLARIYGPKGPIVLGAPLQLQRKEIRFAIDGLSKVRMTVEGAPAGQELLAAWSPAGALLQETTELRDLRDAFKAPFKGATATLDSVPSGPADIVVYLVVDGSPSHAIMTQPVDLAVGEQDIHIRLVPLHEVSIRTDPDVTELTLDRPGLGTFRATPTDGVGRFQNLPTGTYNLSARTKNPGLHCDEVPLAVPAKGPLRYSPQPFDAILVNLFDPAGYGASIGLRDGDLIVGFDDTLFGTDPGAIGRFRSVYGTPSKFVIRRGAEDLVLVTTLPIPDRDRDGFQLRQGSTTLGNALRPEPRVSTDGSR